MNTIAGTLLYHTDEIMAFGLLDMILNDYNLKSVYMSGFPGLYLHCRIIESIIAEEKPNLSKVFKLNTVALSDILNG